MLVFISEHRRHTQTGYGCTRGRDGEQALTCPRSVFTVWIGTVISACFHEISRWNRIRPHFRRHMCDWKDTKANAHTHRAQKECQGSMKTDTTASCAKLDCWTQCSLILIRVVWEETDGIKWQLVTRQSCSHPWLKFLLLNIKHFPLRLCTADPFSSKKHFSFCRLAMLLYWFNLTSIVFAQRQILLRSWSRPKSYQQVNIVKMFRSDSKLSESGGKKSDIFWNSWLLISRNSLYESGFVGKLGWGLAEGEAKAKDYPTNFLFVHEQRVLCQ